MIDTSSKKKESKESKDESKDEDKKEEDKEEETENVVKLSPEEQEELEKLTNEQYTKQITEIYAEIIKKADLLIMMQVPESMQTKEDESKDEFSIMRAPSYF